MKDNIKDSKLLDKIDKSDGMTVPPGYFADFANRMESMIPERTATTAPEVPETHSVWYKIRPYVYMAAMFAGIWCMMNLVDLLNITDSTQQSALLAEAISDDNFMNEYYIDNSIDEDFLDNLYEAGYSPSEICGSN